MRFNSVEAVHDIKAKRVSMEMKLNERTKPPLPSIDSNLELNVEMVVQLKYVTRTHSMEGYLHEAYQLNPFSIQSRNLIGEQ